VRLAHRRAGGPPRIAIDAEIDSLLIIDRDKLEAPDARKAYRFRSPDSHQSHTAANGHGAIGTRVAVTGDEL